MKKLLEKIFCDFKFHWWVKNEIVVDNRFNTVREYSYTVKRTCRICNAKGDLYIYDCY